jgi:hypothetical protein
MPTDSYSFNLLLITIFQALASYESKCGIEVNNPHRLTFKLKLCHELCFISKGNLSIIVGIP